MTEYGNAMMTLTREYQAQTRDDFNPWGVYTAWSLYTTLAYQRTANQGESTLHYYNDDGSDPGNCAVCHFYHSRVSRETYR